MPTVIPTIDLAAAVSSQAVLANCLLRSPDVASGALALRSYEGCRSIGEAYGRAFKDSNADVLILAHQDVYLPAGFLDHLRVQLAALAKLDAEWAVAGTIGLGLDEKLAGYMWCTSHLKLLGARVDRPSQAASLDELLLIVRRASGVAFDANLPGFHMYGADIVQIARAKGRSAYVVDAPVVHHSRPVIQLDAGYRAAYRYLQAKWRDVLPIPNLICNIERWPWSLHWRAAQIRWSRRSFRVRPPEPTDDPSLIARRVGIETEF